MKNTAKTKVVVCFGGECWLEVWKGSGTWMIILIGWYTLKIASCELTETFTLVV